MKQVSKNRGRQGSWKAFTVFLMKDKSYREVQDGSRVGGSFLHPSQNQIGNETKSEIFTLNYQWKLSKEVTFNKDRNHLKMVGRAGSGEELLQLQQEESWGWGGISQEWECFAWEEWGQTPGWAPQLGAPEPRTAAHTTSSQERQWGFYLPGREAGCWR